MAETAVQRLRARDFEEFGRWYTLHRQRETGRPASPKTVDTKKWHLAHASAVLGVGDVTVLAARLSNRDDALFLLEELSLKMTPGAMRSAVYALRSFGEYAVAKRWIERHEIRPTDIPPRNPDKAIRVYSPTEMEEFVNAARGNGLRWWAFLAFLADTGRRVGEALSLEWRWFRLDSEPPYIELPYTKNGEPQYIPLPRRLREEVFTPETIAKLKAGDDLRSGRTGVQRPADTYVFPWNYRTVNTRFRRFCERTGLPNRGFHNFRHTVITDRLTKGVPLQAVAALAGHSNPLMTAKRYNHATALHYAKYLD